MAYDTESGRDTAPACRLLPNVRDLGGYACPTGTTRYHRFLRSGSPSTMTGADLKALRAWGVRHVLDLRGHAESPAQTSPLARQDWIRWKNVELFETDVTARLETGQARGDNYLVSSYLSMLSSPAPIREALTFMAQVPHDECALFHCAAGMDRTGMVSMLLLGLAGASRRDIVYDYCLSFAQPNVVRWAVDAIEGKADRKVKKNMAFRILSMRLETISKVYDRLSERFGGIVGYLDACGVGEDVRRSCAEHLLADGSSK